MELSSSITTIITALIASFFAPLMLAWAKHRMSEQTAGKEKNENAVIRMIKLEFDYQLLSRHIDDLESLLLPMVARFRDGHAVSESDIESLEREMRKRPRREKD